MGRRADGGSTGLVGLGLLCLWIMLALAAGPAEAQGAAAFLTAP
jgi:hypothetical protein